MSAIPKNNFNRSKPFYPLIMNFIIQLIGFKELAMRGVMGSKDIDSLISQSLGKISISSEDDKDKIIIQLKKLLGPLELRTEQDNDYIHIDIEEIANELANNIAYISAFVMQSAANVLILAHELCKDKPYHTIDPIWEFLRHCRNAAAHGGDFYFLHGEPRRTAKWGKFEIVPALQGTQLFKGNYKQGLISPGDVIRLLWDIEQVIN